MNLTLRIPEKHINLKTSDAKGSSNEVKRKTTETFFDKSDKQLEALGKINILTDFMAPMLSFSPLQKERKHFSSL